MRCIDWVRARSFESKIKKNIIAPTHQTYKLQHLPTGWRGGQHYTVGSQTWHSATLWKLVARKFSSYSFFFFCFGLSNSGMSLGILQLQNKMSGDQRHEIDGVGNGTAKFTHKILSTYPNAESIGITPYILHVKRLRYIQGRVAIFICKKYIKFTTFHKS